MVTKKDELLGQTLGTCTLERLLGRGGMGVVYLAQQARPRRTVAVKVLMPGTMFEQKSRSEFLARFRREADAIAALDHVNIMPIYAYGELEDLAYLVMPYVTGGTLRQLMEQRGILPLNEAVPIIEQAAAALDCAHAQGIIHRDLKPGNILFHADGRVLLADFGLAKVLKDVQEQDNPGQTALTSAGTIIGTPEYLSPEQGMGHEVDPRTDVYSLGIVLFQMLSGCLPFTGVSPVAIAIKHTLEEPPSLCQLNPGIPHSVAAVVMKAIAKKPEQRYSGAGELARALRAAVSPAHATQQMPALPESTKGRMVAVTLADDAAMPEIPTIRYQEDMHAALTEAAPRLVTPDPVAQPTVITHADVTIAENAVTPVTERPVQPVPAIAAMPIQPSPTYQPATPRTHPQPIRMRLLAGLLAMVLIVGGLTAYLHFQGSPKTAPHSSAGTRTSTAPATKTPPPLPDALVAVGPLLYGAASPGATCDPLGGQWESAGGVKVSCGSDATEITNTGSAPAGIILKTLAQDKPIPDNYVIQVQAIVNPASYSDFGVFFRYQSAAPPGTYAFLVNAANSWKANIYESGTGNAITFVNLPIVGKVEGTITLDIVVQGDRFTFYVNHILQGHAQSIAYTSGAIGLAADAGATVSFKNLAIYALP